MVCGGNRGSHYNLPKPSHIVRGQYIKGEMLGDMCLITWIGLAQVLPHFDVYDSYCFVSGDSNSILFLFCHVLCLYVLWICI